MFRISSEAADMLKKNLLNRCSQEEFGFRLTAVDDQANGTGARIKMDFARESDSVFNAEGITILVGPESLERIADLQLDYDAARGEGFVLRSRSDGSI